MTEKSNIQRSSLTIEQADLFSSDKSAKSTDDLAFCEGISQGKEVEKITEILSRRLTSGSGGSPNMYTSIGQNVLVALNPYAPVLKAGCSLYDDAVALHYWRVAPNLTSPHVFKSAAASLHHLMQFNEHQTVIITGESGSGKTETAKLILKFCASIGALAHPPLSSPPPGSSQAKADQPGSRGSLVGTSSNKAVKAQFVTKALLDSNPILEAFGNAKTKHNSNSSRFGKLLELRFDRVGASAHVAGGLVHSYMLEKSRVVHQQAGERNFHVLHQLLLGAPEDTLRKLGLEDDPPPARRRGYRVTDEEGAEDEEAKRRREEEEEDDILGDGTWRFLTPGLPPGGEEFEDPEDDKEYEAMAKAAPEAFTQLGEALKSGLGLKSQTVRGVWRCLAAMLHLGQLTFVDKDEASGGANMGCDVDDGGCETNENLAHAARLLGVLPVPLHKALSEHILGSVGRRTSIQTQFLDKIKTSGNRDALCKMMYQRLFEWVVTATNRAIEATVSSSSGGGDGGDGDVDPKTGKPLSAGALKMRAKAQAAALAAQRSIQILDIYGFEIFEVNGFEQLLINYANERLQLFFINNSLRKEQDEYEREGLGLDKLSIEDNRHVCLLLDAPPTPNPGLFSILDNQAFSSGLKRGGSFRSKFGSGSKTGSSLEDEAIESSRQLLSVCDDKLSSEAFHRKAHSRRSSSMGDDSNDSSSSTKAADGGGGEEEEESLSEFQELDAAARARAAKDPSSTYGIVFNAQKMCFEMVAATPKGHTYDEVKMQFVKLENQRARAASHTPLDGSAASSSPTNGVLMPSAAPQASGGLKNASVRSAYRGSRHFMSRKENGDLAGQLFGIRHYAGEVMYHAAHLVERNRDAMFDDATHLLCSSSVPFVQRLFTNHSGDNNGEGGGGSGGKYAWVEDESAADLGSDEEDAMEAAAAMGLGPVLEGGEEEEGEEGDEAFEAASEARFAEMRKEAVNRRRNRGGGGGGGNGGAAVPALAAASASSVGVPSPKSGGAKEEARESLCTQMRRGMEDLLSLLERGGNLQYVRCIRSNSFKRAAVADEMLVEEQVRYLGLRENVLMRRVGFCFYQPYEDFVGRYRIISRLTWPPKTGEEDAPPKDKEGCSTVSEYGKGRGGWLQWAAQVILSSGEPSEWEGGKTVVPPVFLTEGKDFRRGRSKIFIKDPSAMLQLEQARTEALKPMVSRIQARFRAYKTCHWFAAARSGSVKVQALARGLKRKKEFEKILGLTLRIQTRLRLFVSRAKVAALRRQYRNKPPRHWALKVQAAYRAYKVTSRLDPKVRETGKKCGERARFFSKPRMVAATKLQACVARGAAGRKKVAEVREQFKNVPPRVWATKVQRYLRGCRTRGWGLDAGVRPKCKAIMEKVAFYSPERKKASTKLATQLRGMKQRKDYQKEVRALALVNRIVRGLLARKERNALLEGEFRGTLSALSSADGMSLVKIASRKSSCGTRNFRIKAQDGGDHGIPPARPPYAPFGVLPGQPTYMLVWKSASFFGGRGGGGVPLNESIKVIRSTPGGIAGPDFSASSPTNERSSISVSRRSSSLTPSLAAAAAAGDDAASASDSTGAAATAAVAAAAGAGGTGGAVTRITIVPAGALPDTDVAVATAGEGGASSPPPVPPQSPTSPLPPSTASDAASLPPAPPSPPSSPLSPPLQLEKGMAAHLILECGDEHTCLRLYRCLVRLGALPSRRPAVDLSQVVRKKNGAQRPAPSLSPAPSPAPPSPPPPAAAAAAAAPVAAAPPPTTAPPPPPPAGASGAGGPPPIAPPPPPPPPSTTTTPTAATAASPNSGQRESTTSSSLFGRLLNREDPPPQYSVEDVERARREKKEKEKQDDSASEATTEGTTSPPAPPPPPAASPEPPAPAASPAAAAPAAASFATSLPPAPVPEAAADAPSNASGEASSSSSSSSSDASEAVARPTNVRRKSSLVGSLFATIEDSGDGSSVEGGEGGASGQGSIGGGGELVNDAPLVSTAFAPQPVYSQSANSAAATTTSSSAAPAPSQAPTSPAPAPPAAAAAPVTSTPPAAAPPPPAPAPAAPPPPSATPPAPAPKPASSSSSSSSRPASGGSLKSQLLAGGGRGGGRGRGRGRGR